MKADVEQLLPRKKEIILYASMTEHQKNFQDHLINKTLDEHLSGAAGTGIYSFLFCKVFWLYALIRDISSLYFIFLGFLVSPYKSLYFQAVVFFSF